MKQKLTFILFLFCVVVQNLPAQTTYSRVYDFDLGSDLGTDIIIEDSTLMTISSGSDPRYGGRYSLKLMKLTKEGDTLWTKRYGAINIQLGLTGGGTLVKDIQGNYYVAGTRVDSAHLEDLMVYKFTPHGDSIWMKTTGTLETDILYAIDYDSVSQKLYCVGASGPINGGDAQEVLWKIDTAGNTNFLNYYGGAGYDYATSMVREGDTIWTGGFTDSYSPGLQSSMIIYDTAGSFIDRYHYGTNGYDGEGLIDKRDSILVMATVFDTIKPRWGVPTVTRLSSNGQVIWRQYFTNGEIQRIRVVKILRDGSILFAGLMHKEGRGNNGGWLGKINADGVTQWGRFYTHYEPYPDYGTTGSFYSIDYDYSTNSIYCIGEVGGDPADSFRTNQDVWILKLDSMGCLIPGCDTIVDGVNEVSLSNNNSRITVFPNPTHTTATVVINQGTPNSEVSFTLHNLTGQQVQANTHQLNTYGYGEWQIDCSGFSPGMYLYHVTSEKGIVGRGKLVVE